MRVWLAVGVFVGLAGCQPNTVSSAPAETTPAQNSASKEAKPPEVAKIPEALKHDGFLYSGFTEGSSSQTFEVTIGDQAPTPSTTVTRFTGVKDGKATFERTRDGAMSAAGSDVVSVDESGVSVVSVSIGKLDKPSIELPANIDIGTSWKSETSIESETQGTIQQTGEFKVVKDEPVKVPAGEFTARKITFSGKMELAGNKFDVSGTYWYVKGKGAVKSEIVQMQNGKQQGRILMVLTK